MLTWAWESLVLLYCCHMLFCLPSVGQAVSSQRDMGRQDEILVLDEDAGERLLLGGSWSSAPASFLSSQQQPHAELLCSAGCAALAAVGSVLKGLPQALMQEQQRREGVVSASTAQDWMPELSVPANLMLAVYPGIQLPVCQR